MPVMRSVFYVPSNNPKMMDKAPTLGVDVLTLDLEDAVPPAEKETGRAAIRAYLHERRASQVSPALYVRVNNWETGLTEDDLEAVIYPGLDGICLAKCGEPAHVQRLAWKLEELERRRGMAVGSVAIQLLIETARGVIHAYPSAIASARVNSLIFGAVDFAKDMRVTLTAEGVEQLYGRYHTAVAARAAGCVAIDAPYVGIKDPEGFERSTREGRQMGYEGRMLIHPSQIEPAHRIYTPSPEQVEWALGVKKAFEEEGLARGVAAVSFQGKMVDTPVYENALAILRTMQEIEAAQRRLTGSG
ncbi:MAG: CoA ester lyase, partial [Thiobacillaceae bacterium]|nr:CoA ester lyase [Thiobacillaceae bacterium]